MLLKTRCFWMGGGGGMADRGRPFFFFLQLCLSFSNLRHLFLKYYNKIKHSKYS